MPILEGSGLRFSLISISFTEIGTVSISCAESEKEKDKTVKKISIKGFIRHKITQKFIKY
jgi:hypothetical protein